MLIKHSHVIILRPIERSALVELEWNSTAAYTISYPIPKYLSADSVPYYSDAMSVDPVLF